MAQNVGELTEHIYSDCRAIIFLLQNNAWKDLTDGKLARIELVGENTGLQLSCYRIRGTLDTGQIIINIVLEKDLVYVILDDRSSHRITTKQNIFLLRVTEDPNGDHFAVVVQNILRSIKENSPVPPRQAWMPAAVKQQPLASPPQPIREQLLNASDAGKTSPLILQPQGLRRQNLVGTGGLSASTPCLAQAPRTLSSTRVHLQSQKVIEDQLDVLCDTLALAISTGDVHKATEISQMMAQQNIQLYIRLKNPKTITVSSGGDSFSLRVIVEDRETSGGAFAMKVSPTDTIEKLQQEVADRYGFPPKVQKWIIAKKMAKPKDTLASLNIKNGGSTAFLYLVSGITVGIRREEFEHFINKSKEQRNTGSSMLMDIHNTGVQSPPVPSGTVGSGTQLSRAVSLPSLITPRQSSETVSSTSVHRTQREVEISNNAGIPVLNQSNPAGIPVAGQVNQAGIPVQQEVYFNEAGGGIPVMRPASTGSPAPQGQLHNAQSVSDIQAMVGNLNMGGENIQAQSLHGRFGQEENEVEPQGWTCESCTFVNTPTRPGCEVCGMDRPADYVMPQNPHITEQEKLRLQKEREQTEIFQRTLDRQQQEQEHAREINFQQLVQTAQQNLIRNTEVFDCAICFMDVQPGEGVVLRECLHCFCQDCLREHIRNCTDPEVQCPFQDNEFACHFVITAMEIKALLSEQDFHKFLNRSLATAESQAPNSFHCKTPNCPGWCIYEDNSNVFPCPVCHLVNCLTCKAIHHPEMNCKEYQEDLQRRAQNDVAAQQTQKFLEEMIQKGDAMKCPQCAIILLKKDGCDWMRCSMCRLEICWATRGPRWGPQGVGDHSGGCKCRVEGKKCHPKCKNCH